MSHLNYKTECKIKRAAYKEDVLAASFTDPKVSLQEEIKNITYRLKIDIKTKLNVLESDIADVRRKTPIELERFPLISVFTCFLPGLGQLLNKQYVKAGIFFLSSIPRAFIVFI